MRINHYVKKSNRGSGSSSSLQKKGSRKYPFEFFFLISYFLYKALKVLVSYSELKKKIIEVLEEFYRFIEHTRLIIVNLRSTLRLQLVNRRMPNINTQNVRPCWRSSYLVASIRPFVVFFVVLLELNKYWAYDFCLIYKLWIDVSFSWFISWILNWILDFKMK
jgi:hypothetical protein